MTGRSATDPTECVRLYESGLTQTEVATRIGRSLSWVSKTLARLGKGPKTAGRKRNGYRPDAETTQRAARMAALYRDGYTLEQIGQQYGVTRERVRQVIGKYHGLSGEHGGKTVTKARNDARKRARRDARSLVKWGCTWDRYVELRSDRKIMAAYHSQRGNAARRGIGWELNLWQWWTIWIESGHWEQRGLRHGQYVMARFGDVGPYAVGNVEIILSAENISQGRRKSKNSGLPLGVHFVARNKRRPFVALKRIQGVDHYLGSFATPELAHAAYLAASPANARSHTRAV